MKEVDVITEVVIDRPINDVADFASNPDNATTWYANIKTVAWKTTPPLQKGSLMNFTAKFLGRSLDYTYEVVEFLPNEKFVMRTADGPFPMETTYAWKKVNEDRTHMTLRNRGMPSGFSKFFAPMMASMMRKANQKDLALLKEIMEK